LAERHGIVYLAEDDGADPRFGGYWDNGVPPAMLEQGPGWTNAASAVAWGRERAPVVLIRLGHDRSFSAGDRQPLGEHLPEWTPESE
jgi:hypothetical protein